MGWNDADPQKLTEIATRAQKALDDNNPEAAQQVLRELAAEVGVDGLVEAWKSGS